MAKPRNPASHCNGPALLGDLLEDGLNVFCWCNRCSHHAILDSALLAKQLGPLTPVPGLARRMRCSNCGGNDVSTRPNWPSIGPIARHT